jgi:hypothetical protein
MKVKDLVLIKGTQTGGLIDFIIADTAYLLLVSRPGERVPYKLSDLEVVVQ